MNRLAALIFFILILPSTLAIGIAQDYLENGELILEPGQEAIHNVEIQNVQNEAIAINFSVEGDYTTIDGQSFIILEIPADQVRTRIQLDIDIPNNAEIGSRHPVAFAVRQVSTEQGTVPLGVRLRNDFTIVVAEEGMQVQQEVPAQQSSSWPYILIAAILLVLIIVFVFTRSSKIASRITGPKHKELIDVLKHMSDQEFSDFKSNGVLSAWIAGEVQDPTLKQRLEKASSRREAVSILRNGK